MIAKPSEDGSTGSIYITNRQCGCVQHLQYSTYNAGTRKLKIGPGTMSTSEAQMVLRQLLQRK
jgi:hypothetical protein